MFQYKELPESIGRIGYGTGRDRTIRSVIMLVKGAFRVVHHAAPVFPGALDHLRNQGSLAGPVRDVGNARLAINHENTRDRHGSVGSIGIALEREHRPNAVVGHIIPPSPVQPPGTADDLDLQVGGALEEGYECLHHRGVGTFDSERSREVDLPIKALLFDESQEMRYPR